MNNQEFDEELPFLLPNEEYNNNDNKLTDFSRLTIINHTPPFETLLYNFNTNQNFIKYNEPLCIEYNQPLLLEYRPPLTRRHTI